MAAHRRVDTAMGPVRFGVHDPIVQRFTHAVQSLKFEVSTIAGHLENRGRRVRVVGGELCKKRLVASEYFLRAGEIGYIAENLAREYRIAVEAALLRALYFRIPVRPLDQAQHEAPLVAPGEFFQPVHRGNGAFLVGLQRNTKTVPSGE